jgi:hypothetical protein
VLSVKIYNLGDWYTCRKTARKNAPGTGADDQVEAFADIEHLVGRKALG